MFLHNVGPTLVTVLNRKATNIYSHSQEIQSWSYQFIHNSGYQNRKKKFHSLTIIDRKCVHSLKEAATLSLHNQIRNEQTHRFPA